MLTEETIRIILHFHLSGRASTLDYSGCSPSNITDQCYHTGNSIIQIHEMTRSLWGLFTGALNTELLQDQYSGAGERGIPLPSGIHKIVYYLTAKSISRHKDCVIR